MALADLALEPPNDQDEPVDAEPDANVATDEKAIEKLRRWADPLESINIAEELEDSQLSEIAMKVIRETEIDEESRREWLEKSKEAMKLAMQVTEAKQYPWPNASNVIWPLLTEASNQFAARAYGAVIMDRNVVKGVVDGNDDGIPLIDPATRQPVLSPEGEPEWLVPPGAKKEQATKIGDHMSWQLLQEMDEWEEETDKLLHVLPIVGCEFRKTYYDPTEGRNMSVRVAAKDLVINYWAKSLTTAPRLTELLNYYPHEIEEEKRSGRWLDQDYGRSLTADQAHDDDAPVEFFEQHRRIDLDDDGYAEPYTVTVAKDSMKVARIVARYDAEGIMFSSETNQLAKIVPVDYYTKYDFMPNREGGIYGEGLGQLLTPINAAVNTTINQLLDAGHLANLQGGFIGKGLSMHSGQVKFRPGEWKVVNSPGAAIRDAIVPMPAVPPSDVLFKLLGLLIEAGKQISSVKDVITGEIKAQTMSPTVFLALVEQGLKVFTATWKRIHRSLKREYDKLYRLNRLFLEEQASYQVGSQWRRIKRTDYEKGSGVAPVSDPNMVADAQRIARAQFLMEIGAQDPHFDARAVRMRALEAAQIEKPEELLPEGMGNQPDPALIIKGAELELKQIQVKAAAIRDMAGAVKSLAEADEKVAETFNTWAVNQIMLMQQSIEAINGQPGEPGAGGAAGDAAGGGSGQRRAVPGMEASPGNAGAEALPGGLPAGAAHRAR
jgi:chaperonin GroES